MHRRERALQLGLPQFLRRIDCLRHADAIGFRAGLIRFGNLRDAVFDPVFVLPGMLRAGGSAKRGEERQGEQKPHFHH